MKVKCEMKGERIFFRFNFFQSPNQELDEVELQESVTVSDNISSPSPLPSRASAGASADTLTARTRSRPAPHAVDQAPGRRTEEPTAEEQHSARTGGGIVFGVLELSRPSSGRCSTRNVSSERRTTGWQQEGTCRNGWRRSTKGSGRQSRVGRGSGVDALAPNANL